MRSYLNFGWTMTLLLWAWAAVASAAVAQHEIPIKSLQPSKLHRQTAVIITRVVDRYHFRKVALDDRLSAEIFKRYLEALDANKSFLTRQDIQDFSRYKNYLDNALKTADLDAAFEIFRRYRQRVTERVAQAKALLDNSLDFTIDESYTFDRTDADWLKNDAELADLWRRRVKNDILTLRMLGKSEKEIHKELAKRYEGIDSRVRQFTADDVFETFMNAYTTSLEPHTSYMSPQASENFDISMRLSLEGIGAVLRTKNEFTEIVKTVPGGPADASGQVSKGDRIIGVGQGEKGEIESILDWRLQDVVERIRGPKGTLVRLEILPKGAEPGSATRVVKIQRNEIKLEEQAAKQEIIQGLPGMGDRKIGSIEIPVFYRDFQARSEGDKDFRSTTRDVKRILRDLINEGVDGIVIDLRNNGGGSLSEATELTGLFIKSGPVVQVLDSNGHLDIEEDQDPEVVYKGPMAVLVNSDSASASEIFAGAIQDYGRGMIIGEPTFGKGTVQTLIDLGRFIRGGDDDLGRLRLTMAQFFRISGSSTQFRGVVPDVQFPYAGIEKDHGERSLDNALPWSSIDPARSAHRSKLTGVDRIISNHKSRIAKAPGFQFLEEERKSLQELRDRKSLSLMESKRREDWMKMERIRRVSENRFRRSVGLKTIPEDPAVERDEDDEEGAKAIGRIGLNEAVILLSDYIQRKTNRATTASSMLDF